MAFSSITSSLHIILSNVQRKRQVWCVFLLFFIIVCLFFRNGCACDTVLNASINLFSRYFRLQEIWKKISASSTQTGAYSGKRTFSSRNLVTSLDCRRCLSLAFLSVPGRLLYSLWGKVKDQGPASPTRTTHALYHCAHMFTARDVWRRGYSAFAT